MVGPTWWRITTASGLVLAGAGAGMVAMAVLGVVLELSVLQHFYRRDHLSQVLGTFALLLMANEAVRMVWGPRSPFCSTRPMRWPGRWSCCRVFLFGLPPVHHRWWAAVAPAAVPAGHPHAVGMQVRAGASNRDMALAWCAVRRLFTGVFGWVRRCGAGGRPASRCWRCRWAWGESILDSGLCGHRDRRHRLDRGPWGHAGGRGGHRWPCPAAAAAGSAVRR